ncbi:hypothetical protein RRG08_038309 [Elysia crispata]|uniref:Uncharacterized protein n=1 Tax=Elysia crispata TaxID=231223 RepID=A0AAE1ANA2_9GAST|nr:hypothetical protein RRG08_038309 [Elysia crispata]
MRLIQVILCVCVCKVITCIGVRSFDLRLIQVILCVCVCEVITCIGVRSLDLRLIEVITCIGVRSLDLRLIEVIVAVSNLPLSSPPERRKFHSYEYLIREARPGRRIHRANTLTRRSVRQARVSQLEPSLISIIDFFLFRFHAAAAVVDLYGLPGLVKGSDDDDDEGDGARGDAELGGGIAVYNMEARNCFAAVLHPRTKPKGEVLTVEESWRSLGETCPSQGLSTRTATWSTWTLWSSGLADVRRTGDAGVVTTSQGWPVGSFRASEQEKGVGRGRLGQIRSEGEMYRIYVIRSRVALTEHPISIQHAVPGRWAVAVEWRVAQTWRVSGSET